MPFMAEPRFLLAIVIAPAAPALAIFFLGIVMAEPSSPWSFLTVALAALTGYAGLFAVGLPLFHFLGRMGWLSLPVLVIFGALAGIAVFGLFSKFLGFLLGSSTSFDFAHIFWGAGLGFTVALLFGLIAGIPLRIPKGPF